MEAVSRSHLKLIVITQEGLQGEEEEDDYYQGDGKLTLRLQIQFDNQLETLLMNFQGMPFHFKNFRGPSSFLGKHVFHFCSSIIRQCKSFTWLSSSTLELNHKSSF